MGEAGGAYQETASQTLATAEVAEIYIAKLEALGEEIGVIIRCQHEDIFNMMHRV